MAFEYLITGRDAKGRRRTQIIAADTADAAVRQLEDSGYSEALLHTDELVAPFYKPSELVKWFRPAELVQLRDAGPLRFAWLVSLPLARQLKYLIALSVIVVIVRRMMDTPWDAWDLLGLSFACSPWLLGLYWSISSSRRAPRRLLFAIGWARWEEALHLVRIPDPNIKPFEVHLRTAQALAGLGRLSEALMEFDRVKELPNIPEHCYWAYQAMVYSVTREPKAVMSALERSYELLPGSVTVAVELAARALFWQRDMRRARMLLAEVQRHPVPDTAEPNLLAAKGLLAVEEGRSAEAIELLTRAVRLNDSFVRGNPILLPVSARFRVFLCMAHVANGDNAAARRAFQRAEPLLRAYQQHDLIQRSEQAIG